MILNNRYLKAILVALTVGSILLIINQFEAIFGNDELVIWKLLLTYCVPFGVYLLGSKSKREPDLSGNLLPRRCHHEKHQHECYIRQLENHGKTVRDVASTLNVASKNRLKVANSTINATNDVIAQSDHIDEVVTLILDNVTDSATELSQCIHSIANDDQKANDLLTHINRILTAITDDVQTIKCTTKKLRHNMYDISQGMVILNNNTEAVVEGSSRNKQTGEEIICTARELRDLSIFALSRR